MFAFGKFISKHRILLLILAFVLLIPSAISYFNTKVNYDVLYYLPDDLETMQGQDILLQDFGKGAYALFLVNGMSDEDAAKVKEKVEQVDHVSDVIWYDSILDDSIPQEMLPDEIYDVFHSDNGTMMAIFFDEGTSSEGTMDAIEEIRDLAGEQCFLSSMSAIVTDTKLLTEKELFWYVLIAVILSAIVLALTMDSWMAPILFLLNIGISIVYNLGTNFVQGEISFITMSLTAVLQLAVTMDYSIFLWNSYKEQKQHYADKSDAMAQAISQTIVSVSASSLTTVAGFIALCFMSFTLGLDLGIVMAKGVILGVLCTITILPAMVLTFDKLIDRLAHKPININGNKIAEFVVKHYKAFFVVLMLFWIPAVIGYQNFNVYYNLDSSLPDYLPSVQANKELDEGYDMNSIMMLLVPKDMDRSDAREMLEEMENIDGVEFALGTASLLPASVPEEFIPDDLTSQLEGGEWQLMLISSDYKVATDEVNAQVTKIEDILKKYCPSGLLIGEAPCTKDLIDITAHDFQVVSSVSIIAIFILILFALKSISLPVILVLVIELAIYINMGLSFYTNTTLPFIASVVVGTIQLGATVDYAILMTTRYQQERLAGKDKKESTTIALATSIPSILTSALGFFAATIGVGIYSDVDMISSLCLLLARGAIISMILVFLLLPSMYMIFDGLILRTSWGMRKKMKNREVGWADAPKTLPDSGTDSGETEKEKF